MMMNHAPSSELIESVDAVIFDCDGTLSSIEGIDYLAKNKGVSHQVEALTAKAMGESGLTPDIYSARLKLVTPNLPEVQALATTYFEHQVPHAAEVIEVLSKLNKAVYLVSAGINPAVSLFGKALGIPDQHIFAVNLYFNEHDQFENFDQDSPLIHNTGKRMIVTQIKSHHSRLLYVGDGLNDLAVYDLVSRFVGFGGVFYRANIARQCQFYLQSPSLAPLLPLALTNKELSFLKSG